jgi:two-component system sensor histidine kinase VicK
MLKMMFGDLKMILMQNKDNMPFNAPAKIGGIKYNMKKSVTELKVRTKQRPCPDFERMQMAIKSLNAGIWALDISTNSLVVCNRCKEIIPICNEENVKVSCFYDLIVAGYDKEAMEVFLLALKTGSSFNIEVPIVVVNDSRPKWLRITGTSAFNNENPLQKIYGMVEDISDRKNNELLKQDFLAMVERLWYRPISFKRNY